MEQAFTIINRKGKKLAAVLHYKDKKTDKIIIVSHSFKADKDYDTIIKNFCVEAGKAGLSALCYDVYGAGDSEGEYSEATITSGKEDLEDVINYVDSLGYKDIGLAGLSLGATISVLAYSEVIKYMVFWSPAFEPRLLYEYYKERFKDKDKAPIKRDRTGDWVDVGRAMWEEMGKIDLLENIKALRCPVLIIHGGADPMHLAPARKMIMHFGDKIDFRIIEDCHHDFLDPKHEKLVIKSSIDWIKSI